MMLLRKLYFCLFLLSLHAQEHTPRFEGILGEPTAQISNMTANIGYFLPYNPVIVEAGGYEGENAKRLANLYPQGKVFVFEPNPRAFQALLHTVEGLENVTATQAALYTCSGTVNLHLNHGVYNNDIRLEPLSSLLQTFYPGNVPFSAFKGPSVEVPGIVLDDWCRERQVDHIDCLLLDTEGFELQILKSSPEILKTVIVIHTKTNLAMFRKGTTQYRELYEFLAQSGFTLLSHWYLEGLQGEATFIQTRIFDAIFR